MPKRSVQPFGFIVLDACEDWEQPLAIRHDAGMPAAGILDYRTDDRDPVALFPDRVSARKAIARTHAWGDAHEAPEKWPRRSDCVVRPVVPTPDAIAAVMSKPTNTTAP